MLQISMVIILLGMPNIFVANSYERMRNISGFCVLTRANHRNCTNIRKQKQNKKNKNRKKKRKQRKIIAYIPFFKHSYNALFA